jgi:hypothetical protein
MSYKTCTKNLRWSNTNPTKNGRRGVGVNSDAQERFNYENIIQVFNCKRGKILRIPAGFTPLDFKLP